MSANMINGRTWRCWILLKEIGDALGPQEFGRVCQVLFAMTLVRLGFRISVMQLSGRPDIAARRRKTFAFEVKAPSGDRVLVAEEDLRGVRDQGEVPVIAVLTYPEVRCEWILVDAARLSPGLHEKVALRRLCIAIWQSKVNKAFPEVVSAFHQQAIQGAHELRKAYSALLPSRKEAQHHRGRQFP